MNTMPEQLIKQKAHELGFNFVGIISAKPAHTLQAYFRWIEAEMHGTMGYMARSDRQMRRADLNHILSGVQSMVLVGVDYRLNHVSEQLLTDPARGRIASYAWGFDYHHWVAPRLEALASWLGEHLKMRHRVYVDTGAILERAHAQQAGMGFIGKNTMLIHPRRGSFFFLGEILLDVVFDHYDTPLHKPSFCGTCTKCLSTCPTDAFPAPYVLDARRCISYLTIEHKGEIDPTLRPQMGNWIYGCDICQDVCPWNRFVIPTTQPYFMPQHMNNVAPLLTDVLMMDETDFITHYSHTPIERIGLNRLIRNACVATGNWKNRSALPALEYVLAHNPDAIVKSHAEWAIQQILG